MTGRGTDITGIVLAGGQGRRMGGVDKGWVELAGAPMIAHVLRRLAPQVDDILINANQNLERYRALGHPVFADTVGGFAGPLAGLHAGMTHATREMVVTVPCDSPFLPPDLVDRLHAGLVADARAARRREDVRPAAPGVCAGAPRRPAEPRRVSRRRRKEDRCVVRGARGRRSRVRRRSGGVPQHQHDRRACRRREGLTPLRLPPSDNESPRVRSCRRRLRESGEDAARSLVRRRLRSGLDARRARARADPLVPRAGDRDRARSDPAGARPRARGRRRVADRGAGARQFGDGRLRRSLRRPRARSRNRVDSRRRILRGQAFGGDDRRRPMRADLHRRRHARRRRLRRHAGANERGGGPRPCGRRRDRESGTESPLRRRRSQSGTSSCSAPGNSCIRPSSG